MNQKDPSNGDALPRPWAQGDNIPWHDPGFSERMLREHLSQRHDHASRRFAIIDKHVQWITRTLLTKSPSRILDLGCGPGLYLQRLALLGHDCVGIDYSPASIAYAQGAASRAGLPIRYRCEDMRRAEWGVDFDLAMLIWGEFNVFSPQDAQRLLRKVAASLTGNGRLLLEAHTYDAICKRGQLSSSQYETGSGLFSPQPHQCIQDYFWHADLRVATARYTVTERATGETAVYAASYQAYTNAEYEELLRTAGFRTVMQYPSLTGDSGTAFEDLVALVAQR